MGIGEDIVVALHAGIGRSSAASTHSSPHEPELKLGGSMPSMHLSHILAVIAARRAADFRDALPDHGR